MLVATPADRPPLMRMHGALLATAIAEYFRDQGKNVLLLMDSLTRFAQAQREIALALGEPPRPPAIRRRCSRAAAAGRTRRQRRSRQGSMTAFYTVLTEGDDQQDPIVDAARAILDGHIVLTRQSPSRPLSGDRREASISRCMADITDPGSASRLRKLNAAYAQTAT